tara:strand:+ start:848 stop:1765 length:918 start_codon:yes stop_codon:yes gene_type:complete
MYNIILVILSLFIYSCSNLPEKKIKTSEQSLKMMKSPIFKKPQLTEKIKNKSSYLINNGSVILVKHELKNDLKNIKIFCSGKKIDYVKDGLIIKFLISESYFSKRTKYKCVLSSRGNKLKVITKIIVKQKKYKEENINVARKRVFLVKKDLNRVIKERRKLNKIYRNSSNENLFNDSFKIPLLTKITSYYGTRRLYNNKKKSQHLGTDFRAPEGTPIYSSNKGKVVFAGSLFYTGNTVILDHGLGVFTVYAHLSKIQTKLNNYVDEKTLLGLSGKTGRVTGPHLHWGVKIQGHWVNGLDLVKINL